VELSENIMDSVKYPISNFKNLIIFAALILFSFLIIPIPFVFGYIYKVASETLEGNDTLPEFENAGELAINGLKLIGVFIIYGIVLTIIISIIMAIGAAIGSDAINTLILLISVVICIITGLFLIPVPINMILNDDSFAAAFDFGAIKEMITNVGIGNYIIWYIVIAIIGSIASSISWFLTFILIGILGYAWTSLFEARSTALLFGFE
jgi:hypothetical protein